MLFVVVPLKVTFREYRPMVVAHSEGVLFLYLKIPKTAAGVPSVRVLSAVFLRPLAGGMK